MRSLILIDRGDTKSGVGYMIQNPVIQDQIQNIEISVSSSVARFPFPALKDKDDKFKAQNLP